MYVNGKISSSPNHISYAPIIEDAISIIEPEMSNFNTKLSPRWLSLKLLDGNEKILNSIEENLNISFSSKEIQEKLSEATLLLESNLIDNLNLKDNIVANIVFESEQISQKCTTSIDKAYSLRDRKIDKVLTSKKFGIPIMLTFLAFIFWITISFANIPSQALSSFFTFFEEKLIVLFEIIHAPHWLTNILIYGMYKTVAWVISVMLPPMAIFFPLFTLLEDLGVLPRIAFNLDGFFKKACASR